MSGGLKPGAIIINPRCLDWGPGKVVGVVGKTVHVIFRDVSGRQAKAINTSVVQLQLAPAQRDDVLDHLPPPTEHNGKWVLPNERLALKQAVDLFLSYFPLGFEDAAYIDDPDRGERAYKWRAHELCVQELPIRCIESQMAENRIGELSTLSMRAVGRLNLLSPYEQSAMRDALQQPESARRFFSALHDLLTADAIDEQTFTKYAEAVCDLPAERSRVVTWPVATILPFLHQPHRHLFVKPSITKQAADRLGFNLNYDAKPNWLTYSSALKMASIYKDKLAALKPRDLIDVQSFFYVVCGGYERLSS